MEQRHNMIPELLLDRVGARGWWGGQLEVRVAEVYELLAGEPMASML